MEASRHRRLLTRRLYSVEPRWEAAWQLESTTILGKLANRLRPVSAFLGPYVRPADLPTDALNGNSSESATSLSYLDKCVTQAWRF